jgi:hypothetical protein
MASLSTTMTTQATTSKAVTQSQTPTAATTTQKKTGKAASATQSIGKPLVSLEAQMLYLRIRCRLLLEKLSAQHPEGMWRDDGRPILAQLQARPDLLWPLMSALLNSDAPSVRVWNQDRTTFWILYDQLHEQSSGFSAQVVADIRMHVVTYMLLHKDQRASLNAKKNKGDLDADADGVAVKRARRSASRASSSSI